MTKKTPKNSSNKLATEYQLEIEMLQEAISKISDTPESRPSLESIRRLVRTEVAKKKLKQRKSLYIFSMVAVIILTTLLTVFVKDPLLFLRIQLASLLAVPLAIFKFSKKAGTQ